MVKKKRMSLEQIETLLEASEEIRFEGKERREIYDWLRETLVEQQYHTLNRRDRGVVRRYVMKMTGMSRAQAARLIGRYVRTGEIPARAYRRRRFASVYTRGDIELLAETDEAHETLSGPGTQKILHREYHDYGKKEYERLAGISVAHIYNLRRSVSYRKRRIVYEKTKPVRISIGERRKPEPQGRPGFVRVDTVHQGDQDGMKGVYHINIVDEVTQWQVVGAVEQISEAYVKPVLEQMLAQVPFRILGFHSDNGSEFINYTVEKILSKMKVTQTKSRPRHSNDNGLVESKNAAVIRKHMGHGYIAACHAGAIDKFYREHLNPYLNYHRPCGVPEMVIGAKGKEKRFYRWYATPWEILRQLPDLARRLKDGLTVDGLNKIAAATGDTAAARQMQQAKAKLFTGFGQRRSA